MKLITSVDDYCLLKVKIASSLSGKECLIVSVTPEELVQLDASAKSMLMETPMGNISQHIAILRYIADSQLLGVNDLDRAMVDQWLEFSWEELGNKLCTLDDPNLFQ